MPFQRLSLDVLSLLLVFPLPVRLRRQRARTSHRANEISAQTENQVWSSRPHMLYSDVHSLKMALRSSLLHGTLTSEPAIPHLEWVPG